MLGHFVICRFVYQQDFFFFCSGHRNEGGSLGARLGPDILSKLDRFLVLDEMTGIVFCNISDEENKKDS